MKKMKRTNELEEFNTIISDIISNPKVKEMKLYRQHYNTNCFDHCYNVALYSYIICKKLNLDYTSAARARNATRFISIWLAKKTSWWKKIPRF